MQPYARRAAEHVAARPQARSRLCTSLHCFSAAFGSTLLSPSPQAPSQVR